MRSSRDVAVLQPDLVALVEDRRAGQGQQQEERGLVLVDVRRAPSESPCASGRGSSRTTRAARPLGSCAIVRPRRSAGARRARTRRSGTGSSGRGRGAASTARARRGRHVGLPHQDRLRVVLGGDRLPARVDLVHLGLVAQVLRRRRGARLSLISPCATSMRSPRTPRSNQKRRMSSNSSRTSGFHQSRSGCCGANWWR